MWDKLAYSDIVEAKEETSRRRKEMLSRHADEMHGLDAEYAAVETLDRLLDDFAAKYRRMAAASPPEARVVEPAAPLERAAAEPEPQPELAAAEPEETAKPAAADAAKPATADSAKPAHHDAPKPPRERRELQQRSKSGTVFDTFSRALSRTI